MLGEIPSNSSFHVAYWKLENTSDSSGNGRTLTNNNTVIFNRAKFTNGADFGSSGTNQGLQILSNIWGNETNTDIHFWYKLNNTTAANAVARFFTHSSTTNFVLFCGYSISGGNITISATLSGTPSNATASITVPVDSQWHYIRVARVNLSVTIRYDITTTSTASVTNIATGAANAITLGNATALNSESWIQLDECFINKTSYTVPQIYRYYTQAKGRFCI